MERSKRPYAGSSADERSRARRAALLSAARKVFGEKGYHSATVRSICEVAGLTERYFYENFENSEALFIAMHRQTSERILAKLREAAVEAAHARDNRLTAMLTVYYDDILADPVSARLFAVDAGFISPVALQVCAEWREQFCALLAEALERPTTNTLLRSAVVKGLLGLGVDWMESGFAAPIIEIVDAGRRIAFALRERAPSPARKRS